MTALVDHDNVDCSRSKLNEILHVAGCMAPRSLSGKLYWRYCSFVAVPLTMCPEGVLDLQLILGSGLDCGFLSGFVENQVHMPNNQREGRAS